MDAWNTKLEVSNLKAQNGSTIMGCGKFKNVSSFVAMNANKWLK